MEGLRLILLLIGLLLLAGIYWWGRGPRKRNRPRPPVSRGRRIREPLAPLGISPRVEEGVDYAGTLTDLGDMISEERKGGRWRNSIARAVELGRRLGGRSTLERGGPDEASGAGGQRPGMVAEVLILYVTAPAGAPFSGVAIRDAAERCGMSFGEMGIFHHHGVGEMRAEQNLFCLANMLEPGSFDLATLETLKTEGVALFMRLPTALEAALAFELMLCSARRLCRDLGGELRDGERRPLRHAEIDRMRRIAADAGL